MREAGGSPASRARAVIATLVAVAALLAGCTDAAEPQPPVAAGSPSVDAAVARTKVEPIGGSDAATVDAPKLTAPQRSGLDDLAQVGLPTAVGWPVEISLAGPLPAAGVRLTRTYPAPLDDSARAAFVFYDEDLSAWRAVPSTLAEDRREVTAIVHHLSLWTDIVTTTTAAVTGAADWAFDTLGKLVDTRVDPPKCQDPRPAWVSDVVYIETSKTNPLHFCAGKDPRQPNLLTIKVRVNRGYGYFVNGGAKRSWSYNSGANPATLQALWGAVADVDGTVTKDLPGLFGEGEYVYPGKELDIGVSEQAVRSGTDTALQLQAVNFFGFAVGFLSQKIVGMGLDQAEGTIAAAVVLAGCADSLKDIRDTGTGIKALNDCISQLDVRVAVRLAKALQPMPGLHLDDKAAARLAGKIVGLVSILVEVAMPLFTYIADRNLDEAARRVDVFANPRPSIAQAKSAVAASGIEGLRVGPAGPGGSFTAVTLGEWPILGVFDNDGHLAMLMGTEDATIDGLHGIGPLAPFQKKYGTALRTDQGPDKNWAVVTFSSGVRLQLQDLYTPPDQVGQLILLAPGQDLFIGEFS